MISALRYEWRRITTIRATYILLGCALVVSLLLGWLTVVTLSALSDVAEGVDQPAEAQLMSNMDLTQLVFASTGGVITLIFLGTIAAQAFGQEYRQGTIRLTLTAIPFRGRVFSAKLIVMLLVVAVGWIVTTALTYFLMAALASNKLTSGQAVLDLPYLGRGLLLVLGFCAIVFGVTVLTRILALGVIIPVVLWAVAEPLLISLLGSSLSGPSSVGPGQAGSPDVSWIERVLPFHNGYAFVEGSATMLTSGLTFLAWVLVILAAAWFVFKKRDA